MGVGVDNAGEEELHGRQATVSVGAFVGREAEVDLLEKALTEGLCGHGRLVLIGGEAGIGKTRLAGELARLAEARGAVVAWGVGAEDGAAPPYWPWVQVLRRCGRELATEGSAALAAAADLAELVPAAYRVTEHDHFAGDPQQLRFRLFDGVAWLLDELARARPLVLVFDDLHRFDVPSLRLLEFVAGQLHAQRILMLATCRYPGGVPDTSAVGEFSRLARVATSIGLFGLDESASRRLIADTAGGEVSDRVAAIVRERTAGNPLFMREVVRLLAAQGRLARASAADPLPPLPGTTREVIARRVARLSPGCADVLSRASVLGGDVDLGLLTAVTGTPPAELGPFLDEAVRAGVLAATDPAVGRYRFSHPLIQEFLYADLPVSQRPRLHQRAGEALEVARPAASEHLSGLARHFRLAATSCGPDKGLRYSVLAARRAMEQLAYEEAAEQFAAALQLQALSGAAGSERVRLLLALGEARMRGGDWPGAVEAYEEAADSARRRGDGGQFAQAALGLGSDLGGFEVRLAASRQIDLLEEARAKLRGDSALRSCVLGRLSVASTLMRSPAERAELSREAIGMARRVGDMQALAYALSSHCDALSGAAHSEERLRMASEIVELAASSGSRETELLGRRFRVVALLEHGDVAGVDAEIAAYERVAEALRQPLYRWYVPLWKGMRALAEGRLADAEALTAAARAVGVQAHSRNAEILTSMQRLWSLMEAGHGEEACDLLEDAADDPEAGANVGLFLVRLRVEAGRRVAAQSLLTRLAADRFARVAMEDTAAVHGLMWAADAAVDLADRGTAGVLYDLLRPHEHRFAVSGIAAATLGSIARPLGRLAHLLGRWDAAEAHFARADAAHRRTGLTLLLAHTLRDQAAMAFDRRRTAPRLTAQHAAEDALAEAIAIYRELRLDWRVAQAEQFRPSTDRMRLQAGTDVLNSFRREGEAWTVCYGGRQARVKDRRGLHDLARLLAEPGREFHVLDLVAATASDPRPALETGELHKQGHAGEHIDEQARMHYQRRLSELQQERDEAEAARDSERAARAAAEHDALVAELAAAYGLGGRARRAGDPVERARSAVGWRIRSALQHIERAHPTLGQHLRHSIRTGIYCSYAPEQPTTWSR